MPASRARGMVIAAAIERAGVRCELRPCHPSVYGDTSLPMPWRRWRPLYYPAALACRLEVRGLMNIQYVIDENPGGAPPNPGGNYRTPNTQNPTPAPQAQVLEVNPRASRTVPFVSKAIGVPLAKLAARVMAGKSLKELGFTRELWPKYWAVKESVFPFNRFHGQDILLSPEMRSTGEVMGVGETFAEAFLKSQMASGERLPSSGKVFLSVRDSDKPPLIATKAITMKPIRKRFAFIRCPLYALRAAGFCAGFFKAVLTIISEA